MVKFQILPRIGLGEIVFSKLQFLSIARFQVFFERVGISKGYKLVEMGRNCLYCYQVTVS